MSAPRNLAPQTWPALDGATPGEAGEELAVQPASPAGSGVHGEAVPEEAFRALFEAQAPRVFRLLMRMGVATRDAEDLCQEVFVTAHRNWHGFRGEAKRSTWLCGIAVRLAANHRRLARVRRERFLAEGQEDRVSVTAPQAEGLQASERAATLHRVLASLSEAHREVLVLYELEELGMAEVAEVLDVPLQTGYSRLYAARKALGQALRRAAAQGEL